MTFLLAPMLGSLVLVPLLLIAYLALSRRRARRVEELAQLGFAPTAATIRLRKKRHVPYMFFFVGLTTLLVALARPATTLRACRAARRVRGLRRVVCIGRAHAVAR